MSRLLSFVAPSAMAIHTVLLALRHEDGTPPSIANVMSMVVLGCWSFVIVAESNRR